MINFFPENLAVYETIRKNMVQPDRPEAHAHCMLINNATNTHSEYVILIAYPRQNGYA